MKSAEILIKKYGNRRLYDTAESRYVNPDELAGLVRRGNDVQVVDAKTGHDLTRVTLTQHRSGQLADRLHSSYGP